MGDDNSKHGRILFQNIRELNKSEITPEQFDLTDKNLDEYIADISTLIGIRKFFPIKELPNHSEKNFEMFSNKIEELGIKLSVEIMEIKDFQYEVSKDLEDLKSKLYGKLEGNDFLVDLKFKVVSEFSEVMTSLRDVVKSIGDKSITNEYILIYSNFKEVEKNYSLGLLSREDYKIGLNRVNMSTLDFIDKLIDN